MHQPTPEYYCDIFEAVGGENGFSCDSFNDFDDEICPFPGSIKSIALCCNCIAPDCTGACGGWIHWDW